jgi:hypothetical protein
MNLYRLVHGGQTWHFARSGLTECRKPIRAGWGVWRAGEPFPSPICANCRRSVDLVSVLVVAGKAEP